MVSASSQQTPSVSVIIPVWNGERFLEQAVRSVRAQTVAVAEIIIVDDGSNDRTAEIAQSQNGAIYLRQPRSGQAAARNLGVAHSQGNFVAFLDADDLWAPGKTAWQLDRFAQSPALDAAFGHAIQFRDCYDEGIATPREPGVPAHLPGAMLVRRAAFDRVGGYSREWEVGEVVDWYARALDYGLSMVTIEDVVLYRRIHGDNLGAKASQPANDYLRIMRKVLARRRSDANGLG